MFGRGTDIGIISVENLRYKEKERASRTKPKSRIARTYGRLLLSLFVIKIVEFY